MNKVMDFDTLVKDMVETTQKDTDEPTVVVMNASKMSSKLCEKHPHSLHLFA